MSALYSFGRLGFGLARLTLVGWCVLVGRGPTLDANVGSRPGWGHAQLGVCSNLI